MASFTISPDIRFRAGETIYCYRGTPSGIVPLSITPVTSAVVASDSTTTFTDLQADARYMAGKSTAGPFVSFRTSSETTSSDVSGLVSFDLIEDEVTGWPARPDGAQSGTWIGWTDPTDLMSEFDRFIAIPEPT
jgi:hypothetical protein